MWNSTTKNTTGYSKANKNATAYDESTKNTTEFQGSDAFDSATKLSSLAVALSSLVITLNDISGHFFDNKLDTDFTEPAKIATNWSDN